MNNAGGGGGGGKRATEGRVNKSIPMSDEKGILQ